MLELDLERDIVAVSPSYDLLYSFKDSSLLKFSRVELANPLINGR